MTTTEAIDLPAAGSVQYNTLVLFRLGGREYTTTDRPTTALSLRYLRMLKDEDENTANAYLLTEMVGPEAYDALCDYDDLTPEQFQQIMELARKVAMKGLPDDGPKAPKGRKR